MLTAFFRQDRPTAFLPLPLLVLLLWPGAGTGGDPSFLPVEGIMGQAVTGMPLYAPLAALFTALPWAAVPMGLVLALWLAYGLCQLANDCELHERRNRLPALSVVLLLALMPFGLLPDAAVLGMCIVVWALTRAWTSIGKAQIGSALFDAGLLLGLAGLVYLPYAFLTVVVWATLAVTRPFRLREYVLPLAGLAAMLVVGWGAIHFISPSSWNPAASLHYPAGTAPPKAAHWMYRVVLWAVLSVLAVATVISFTAVYARSVMREKNIRASFLAFAFACGLLALFAWWLDDRIPPVLLAAPGAVLLAYPLLQARKPAWADAGLWCLLLLACWARWAG